MKSTIITILVCGFATVGQAAVLEIPATTILPAPDQQLELMIAGGETDVWGVTLYLATAADAPIFTAADSPYPSSPYMISEDGHELYLDIGFGSHINLVMLPSLLATLTMDATGVHNGEYSLYLSNSLGATELHTSSYSIALEPYTPTFTVSPEPASLGLLGLGLLAFRRRGVSA